MDKSEKLKSKQIEKAAAVLKAGGVVVFPTDTVYGIGAVFNNKKAVEKIYKIKQTPKSQNFPILISSIKQVDGLVEINSSAGELIQKYWPGQLTILVLLRKSKKKIGIRMPDSIIVRSIISQIGKPIIGTSANIHGEKTPTIYEELNPKIIEEVDYIIKDKCGKKIESTVVDTTVNPPKIIRQGAAKIDSIKNFILKIDTTVMMTTKVTLIDEKSSKTDTKTEFQQKGSQVLLPMIVSILKKNKINFKDLTAIEVNPGPGSFTGTRVGVAVANALGYSLDLPVNGKKGKIVEPIYEKSRFD